MKNKAFKLAFTIAIAGVLVFGVSFARAETTQTSEGIMKILQNLIQQLMKMITQLLQQLAQRTTTPSTTTESGGEDATANWKTYNNEEYGVRFEYPKDWEITSDDSGYETATCQSSEYRGQHPGECIKKLDIGLGENGETLLSINTRQCSNMISLDIDNYICFDVALSPEQQYEPPFGVEKLKYLDPEVRNALDKIKDTFYIEPKEEEQVIRKRIDEFMDLRIKRDAEKAIAYLTEKAILGLGGEGGAKNYLIGLSNPHLYKYEITSVTEIPKGTLGYSEGGYKVIIKGYEEYTGEGEVGSFVEGLNLIEVNSQWFINEVIEKRYN